MDKFNFERFIPIQKIDDEQRMVYGYASTPDLDSDGEIISLGALEKAMPEYMKFPTLREMHQAKVAGVTQSAEIVKDKDKQQGMYIAAKIVNQDAWELVKAGAYKAFSIGGNVVKKVGNIIQELDLIEISLVDVPANKAAVIEVWKNGKPVLQKDADGVFTLADLLSHLQYVIQYFEYMGKNTGELENMIEEIKALVVIEAKESEHKDEEASDMIMMSRHLNKRANQLEAMSFEKGSLADLIRKEVTETMKAKAEEIKKAEDEEVKEEVTTDEEVATEEEVSTEAEKTEETDEVESTEGTAEETTEEKSEETEEATEEKSEAETLEASASVELEKAEALLEKLNSTKVVKKEELSFAKTVNSIASTLSKAVSLMAKMEERIVALEAQPAPTKSKSAAFKSEADKEEKLGEDSQKSTMSNELTKKLARKKELEDLQDSMPRQKWATEFGQEAQKLMSEIDILQAREA